MKPTTVINIKDAPKDWEKDPQYVYIGRAGRGHDGYWGNPFAIGKVCQHCGNIHQSGGSTLRCYEDWLRESLDPNDPVNEPAWTKERIDRLMQLKGKTLVCFCKPNPCHGDIMVQLINELTETHIITTRLGSGWAAVQLWWNNENPELGGFWEPYQTGIGRYGASEEAEVEAKEWAEAEEIRYQGIQ